MFFNLKDNLSFIEWRTKVSKSKPDYQGFLAGLSKKRTQIKRKWPKMLGF